LSSLGNFHNVKEVAISLVLRSSMLLTNKPVTSFCGPKAKSLSFYEQCSQGRAAESRQTLGCSE